MLSLSILGNTIFAQLAFVFLHFNFLKPAHFLGFSSFSTRSNDKPKAEQHPYYSSKFLIRLYAPKPKLEKWKMFFFPYSFLAVANDNDPRRPHGNVTVVPGSDNLDEVYRQILGLQVRGEVS